MGKEERHLEEVSHADLVRRHIALTAAAKYAMREMLVLMMNGCKDEGLYDAYKRLQNAVLDQGLWKVDGDTPTDGVDKT
jgi:hypothetical protein